VTEPALPVLLVRAGPRLCALRVGDVVETMRPLPVSPLAGTPPEVVGAAIARGHPAPVVDLDRLLGGGGAAAPRRFVLVRAGARRALLAVDAVIGVGDLPAGLDAAPPLLASSAGGAVEALGALDGELLAVLQAARLVPDGAWEALDAGARA
jgi:purine-binding chemotaxis protein CheW